MNGAIAGSEKRVYRILIQVISTTSVIAAATLAYTLGAGVTAAAGTRLALQ